MSDSREVPAVFYVDIEKAREIADLTGFDPLEVRSVTFVSYGPGNSFAEVTVRREVPFEAFIQIIQGGVK